MHAAIPYQPHQPHVRGVAARSTASIFRVQLYTNAFPSSSKKVGFTMPGQQWKNRWYIPPRLAGGMGSREELQRCQA